MEPRLLKLEQVLVALDPSPHSRAALALGRQLALAAGRVPHQAPARLQPLHVVDPWPPFMQRVLFPYAALGEDTVALEHELIEAARQDLLARFELDAEGGQGDDGVEVAAPQLVYGPVREVVAEAVHRLGPDLVVMGAYGASGVQPEALGATAARVLRSVVQPVLLIRDPQQRPQLRRILVGLDLTPRSTEVLAAALGLALLCEAALQTVYVLPDPLRGDTNQILSGALRYDERAAIARARAKIEALFDRAAAQQDVPLAQKSRAREMMKQRETLHGDPALALLERAAAFDADLLVVGSRDAQRPGSPLLGRVAQTVAARAPCHAMIVPLARTYTGDEAQSG